MPRSWVRSAALAVFLGFYLLSLPSLHAETEQNFTSKVFLEEPQEVKRDTIFWERESYPDIPDYMKHWEFGINIDEDQSPHYFADLIVPLYRTDAGDRTLFFEPRANYADSTTLMNLGLGYRQLVRDRTWILGGNLFYDYESEHSHYRLGGGLEAINSVVELRANGYLGLSPERVTEPGAAIDIVEEAADGFDVEVGGPIPYYSRLKLFGGYEQYEFENFENREGWTARAEYTPTPAVVFDVTLSDNNLRNTAWGVTVAFRPPFWSNHPKETISPLKRDPIMFPDTDMGERLYIPVERHHEIVVESYGQSGGTVTIQITRNN